MAATKEKERDPGLPRFAAGRNFQLELQSLGSSFPVSTSILMKMMNISFSFIKKIIRARTRRAGLMLSRPDKQPHDRFTAPVGQIWLAQLPSSVPDLPGTTCAAHSGVNREQAHSPGRSLLLLRGGLGRRLGFAPHRMRFELGIGHAQRPLHGFEVHLLDAPAIHDSLVCPKEPKKTRPLPYMCATPADSRRRARVHHPVSHPGGAGHEPCCGPDPSADRTRR